MYHLLDRINSAEDIKKLNTEQLKLLAEDLRRYIIEVVACNGGHLASNLGVIELTIALHRAFNTPDDKIIWDVGHQSYAHKILSGRKDEFKTLRTFGGISGFPKRNESEHDAFETGHSSTSISAALGIAKARDLSKESNSVVAVIGDGALTGGMAFEALNHAGDFPTSLIVVLNDNNMSISKNIGGMSKYLSRIRTVPAYFKFKAELQEILNKIPVIGKPVYNAAEKFKNWMKYLLVPGILFEELGFKYLGPIDGHDISNLEQVLKNAKSYNGYPVLVHVITKKGKGYKYAEVMPEKYHGVGPFNIVTGEIKNKSENRSYSNIFGNKLVELAERDEKIVAVSAAMPDGTGLSEFSKMFRKRFFDVGIAEQHAVTFCAGLAANGYKPVFAVYSTFLQRAYDQIVHDVCMQKLPVVFAIDRAGIVGSDGETHHGILDISYLRHVPNITIMSPKDGQELEEMLELAFKLGVPAAIRYPRGEEAEFDYSPKAVEYGKSELLAEGKDGIIIAEGKMTSTADKVIRMLKKEGYSFTLVNMRFIKPMDEEMLRAAASKFNRVYTIEDNVLAGGMGSGVLEFYSNNDYNTRVKIFAHNDKYVVHGENSELYKLEGLDEESIFKTIMEDLKGSVR
ncbi:MAG: 1-deoxy-D-xylulose-5-phosphate synthase [Bacillota bacterium]